MSREMVLVVAFNSHWVIVIVMSEFPGHFSHNTYIHIQFGTEVPWGLGYICLHSFVKKISALIKYTHFFVIFHYLLIVKIFSDAAHSYFNIQQRYNQFCILH